MRKYIFGLHLDRNDHCSDFYEVPQEFFSLEAGDSIVEITLGKSYFAMVTAFGKIYASGFTFYRVMENMRFNQSNEEDYPYELRMPSDDEWTALQVFGCEKFNNIWMTAMNSNGVKRTFGAGQQITLIGHGLKSSASKWSELDVADDVHMTKIVCQGENVLVHAIDN